ncbi:unnamed protein product [Porites evermanni]|uniref:Uncharacterized protein n=1 Tax=Porites evermanni TaxID=104178 RepID=A0ABN8LLL6_9CNID|nr:unnamed protein product [Porites evermanni]
MALLDVGPFLEGVSNLQGKLEATMTKNRLLLEAVESSQSKYTDIDKVYPLLQSLKGRLVASQAPNESLSTELVKFKLEMESFVDEVFNSHDSLSKIRRNSLLHAKELEGDRDKLWYEKGELAAERRRLDLEREELNALRTVMKKTPLDKEKATLKVNEGTNHSGLQGTVDHKEQEEENNENSSLKTSLIGKYRNYEKERESVAVTHVECQTKPIGNLRVADHESQIKKEEESIEKCHKSFREIDDDEHTMVTRHRLLSSRSHVSCFRTGVSGPRHRVFSAPVSRARAKLLAKQEHALKNYKALVDELCRTQEENQSLKLESSTLAKRANEIYSELFHIKKRLTVSIADRDELQTKLRKCKEQIQRLEDTLRKQACGLVHNKKQQRQDEEEIRWSQVCKEVRDGLHGYIWTTFRFAGFVFDAQPWRNKNSLCKRFLTSELLCVALK